MEIYTSGILLVNIINFVVFLFFKLLWKNIIYLKQNNDNAYGVCNIGISKIYDNNSKKDEIRDGDKLKMHICPIEHIIKYNWK